MNITFSQGQFFHPYYGWFDKEPDLPNYAHKSGLVTEKIGPEHFITPDHPLYEITQKINESIIRDMPNSKMAQSLLAERNNPSPPPTFQESPSYEYEPKDLSYYLDGQTKFAGSYQFVYEGNTMTAKVDFQPRGTDPIDVVSHYEEHRANIQSLKKQGFHDDTINMLMQALDNAFVNTQSGGFEGRLLHFDRSLSPNQLKAVTKAFYEEYLRVRDGAGPMKNAMTAAGNTLKRQGLFDAQFDVTTPDVRSQKELAMQAELDALAAASPEWQKNMANLASFKNITTVSNPKTVPPSSWDPSQSAWWNPSATHLSNTDSGANTVQATWDPADTHIRSLNRYVDYSKNTTMSDLEKEARSLSIVFRVRGDQMIDYVRRYEEIMGQLDSKLSSGEISAEHYDRYRADLDTAFIKTHNLNIKGQAMAAGLSENKATALAEAFSTEYIKIREQTAPGERDADKMSGQALQKLAKDGWPAFSLYSSENRAAVSSSDPWYAMMAEDALYWRDKPQPYEHW